MESKFEVSDEQDNFLYYTQFVLAGYVIISAKTYELIDCYISPIQPFAIRSSPEADEYDKIINNFFSDFQFLIELNNNEDNYA